MQKVILCLALAILLTGCGTSDDRLRAQGKELLTQWRQRPSSDHDGRFVAGEKVDA